MTEINDLTHIGGKYKTIGELKKQSKRSFQAVLKGVKDRDIKKYLCDWAFDKFYRDKWRNGDGILTSLIKPISNVICFEHIMGKYFDCINTVHFETRAILTEDCKKIIGTLHSICPSVNGTFMDYLFRRIICEIRATLFHDNRAKCASASLSGSVFSHIFNSIKEPITDEEINEAIEIWNPYVNFRNEVVWEFKFPDPEEIIPPSVISIYPKPKYPHGLRAFENPDEAFDGQLFLQKEKKGEWLKVKKIERRFRSEEIIISDEKMCWIKCLIPDENDNTKMVPNKWLHKIDIDTEEKNYIRKAKKFYSDQQIAKQSCYNPNCSACKLKLCGAWSGRVCCVPMCVASCYTKTCETTRYRTADILKEIFITSLCHGECFGEAPSQENFDAMLNVINDIDIETFLDPLTNLAKEMAENDKDLLLNPSVGYTLSNVGLTPRDCGVRRGERQQYPTIPGDCDLVVGDMLIDIKCTKPNNGISDMLQLLGYTALLRFNEKYYLRVNKISILNFLQGTYNICNIENVTDDKLMLFLRFLGGN